MPEQPCISVVIPTRNRRARLQRAIASVLAQTWRPLELIVIDDGSTDDTPGFLDGLGRDDVSVRVIRNDIPRGGAAARNQGIAMATAPWVAFLDDDDTWRPEKLARQMAVLIATPGAVAATCWYVVSTPGRPDHVVRPARGVTEQHMLWANDLGGASVCLSSTRHLREIGGFDAGLPSAQDWDLWIRLRDRGPVVVCEAPLVCYESHDDPRISTNVRAAYVGRRRLFFRYRARMTGDTHGFALAILLSFRAVCGRRRMRTAWVLWRRCRRLVGLRRQIRIGRWTARIWLRTPAP